MTIQFSTSRLIRTSCQTVSLGLPSSTLTVLAVSSPLPSCRSGGGSFRLLATTFLDRDCQLAE